MLLGIDANGRSLRWLEPERGRKGTRYAVAGVPPSFPDEQFIWNNPSAADPTSPGGLIPLEEAWARLSYLEPRGTPKRVPLSWRYREAAAESTLNPAEAIANAIRQNTPIGHAGEMVSVAIPNHLDETGQDDLISALQALGIFNVWLLWRPIALAMSWASRNPDSARALVDSGGSLWVMDLESYGLELTELKWRQHPRESNYACPVRSYPRRNDFDPGWASRHWADKVAGSVCGNHGRSSSLLWGHAGADFQRFLEGETHGPLVFQDKEDPRRWSTGDPRPAELNQEVVALADVLGRLVPGMQPHDRILAHGWPVGHIGKLLGQQLRRGIDVADKYAVAEGAALYARRAADKRPTYLDTLPQYAIWVSRRDEGNQLNFLWNTLNKDNIDPVVDAGEKWVLSTRTEPDLVRLREETLHLPRYVDKFSLLVQNKTVYDADKLIKHEANVMLAKRLVVDLPTMTTAQTPLRLEMVLRPASGHARFSISARDEQPLFADRHSVDLSWKTAQDEPEHKGYLEAREVVGRIMDNRDNRVMAHLIIRWLKGNLSPQEINRLKELIVDYKTIDDHCQVNPVRVEHCLNHTSIVSQNEILDMVMVPWGYNKYHSPNEPTRGLFGSRQVNDAEIQQIAQELGGILWGQLKPTSHFIGLHWGNPEWNLYRHLNCMFVYTPKPFRERIVDEFNSGHIVHYNQAYSPGRIFAEPEEIESLIMYCIKNGFNAPNPQTTDKHWWSFFRIFCYHRSSVRINAERVYDFIDRLCDYLKEYTGVVGGDRKKYALHAILFSLRLREVGQGDCYLSPHDPLFTKLNSLLNNILSVETYPPTMLAGMDKMRKQGDDFSKYVRRFLNFEDTLADREMGAGLATS
jgi:hypothetical protein